MLSHLFAGVFALALMVPVGVGATLTSAPCVCCGASCTCVECNCDEANCACGAGGDCACDDACTADCCAK